MLIEVKETHAAAAGKKMASIVDANGHRYGVWPENLAKLRIGATYDVDVESWESNGRTHQKITKFAPVNGANGAAPATNGNDATKPSGRVLAPPAENGEAEFVGRTLHALILKGDVTFNERKLTEATAMLRHIWRGTGPQ